MFRVIGDISSSTSGPPSDAIATASDKLEELRRALSTRFSAFYNLHTSSTSESPAILAPNSDLGLSPGDLTLDTTLREASVGAWTCTQARSTPPVLRGSEAPVAQDRNRESVQTTALAFLTTRRVREGKAVQVPELAPHCYFEGIWTGSHSWQECAFACQPKLAGARANGRVGSKRRV
ncbi:hypothetical protein L207DRAFT_527440 [Hyaloscypha variabilis F]|uniref:Uncharacterized protein n=1 Tax=Hyaloscypha variabilis (strain UAMH 11265 / GT02V1 / F) TaxID=1149755 RepID=A0A2J6RVL2_HYAVF|nr:hypothetical protein L207DRAFT_527440 [Hyaloscypha variabilis F]